MRYLRVQTCLFPSAQHPYRYYTLIIYYMFPLFWQNQVCIITVGCTTQPLHLSLFILGIFCVVALKLGIDCSRLPRGANSFVCLPCSCPASKRGRRVRLLIESVPQTQDRLNWKSTAHWNPFASGQKTAPIWLDTRQVRAAVFVLPRSATWYWLWEAKQRTLPRAAAAHNRYPAYTPVQKTENKKYTHCKHGQYTRSTVEPTVNMYN
jgi:hypothetical protein